MLFRSVALIDARGLNVAHEFRVAPPQKHLMLARSLLGDSRAPHTSPENGDVHLLILRCNLGPQARRKLFRGLEAVNFSQFDVT